ncbi:class I SAM-dependent methyltransferase [Rubinisphaera margarita]|uniref:class I SAM-dependent methyltransferase n=1 Tax=Rubinisphaera margarita TaxID=2909586 RepID=UPI001EE89AFF|nr:class I SAM-dependent methyltransferase [Rubinisphaera margarita]MCG6157952.1 class I SAM-dependent methyltransferase [Rubinisphaera margarita]
MESTHEWSEQTQQIHDHYESLLAENYSWMLGDFDERVNQASELFDSLNLPTQGTALDLGCGSGIQTIALARRGLSVTAVDVSSTLLEEVRERSGDLPVETVQADLLRHAGQSEAADRFDVIVCMGDTLTHLQSTAKVFTLIEHLRDYRLKENGRLVFTFRDLSEDRSGTDRILPVRMEEEKLMLTFLEYLPTRVSVHDMILSKTAEGWDLQKSSYNKLRLSLADIRATLIAYKFAVDREEESNGLCTIAATLPEQG